MLQKLRFKNIWVALGMVLVFAIVIGSLVPVTKSVATGSDKIIHISMYFLLMAWFAQVVDSRHRLFLAISFVSLGLFLEVAQRATGYRSFEWGDVLANSAGVALGWTLMHTVLGRTLSLLDARLAQLVNRKG